MIRKIVLSLITFYRGAISPFLAPHCRFYPSCSEYTFLAIERFGVIKGSFYGIKRLLKCHPGNPGGFDPPPSNSHSCMHENNC